MTDCWVELPPNLYPIKQNKHFATNFGVRYNRSSKTYEVPAEYEDMLFDHLDAYKDVVEVLTIGPVWGQVHFERFLAEKVSENIFRVPAIYAYHFRHSLGIPTFDLNMSVFLGMTRDEESGDFNVVAVDFAGREVFSEKGPVSAIEKHLAEWGNAGKVFVCYNWGSYVRYFSIIRSFPDACSMHLFAKFMRPKPSFGMPVETPRCRKLDAAAKFVGRELHDHPLSIAQCNRSIFRYLTVKEERFEIDHKMRTCR